MILITRTVSDLTGAVSLTVAIPRSFSPAHSVLGRLILRRTGDRLRAEAEYIFVVTMGVVLWILADFALWSLLAERIAADPTGRVALAFFAAQVGVPLSGFLVAGIGFRPEIRISLDPDGLTLVRGAERVELPLEDVLAVESVDAVRYHRGLRLLETTRPFINRPVDRVLTVSSPTMTLALGLESEDRDALAAALSDRSDHRHHLSTTHHSPGHP